MIGSLISVRVADIEQVSSAIKRFTLVPEADELLPAFSPGSHVIVHIPDGEKQHRNAYTLIGSSYERDHYEIAVRTEEESRGGSIIMNRDIRVGDTLDLDFPYNLTPPNRAGRKHIIVAEEIGVTFALSYIRALPRMGATYELHYAFRDPDHGAFRDTLSAECGDNVLFYAGSEGQFITRKVLQSILSRQPLGSHLYICSAGHDFIDELLSAAREMGWPESHLHTEVYGAADEGKNEPFTVVLASSNKEVEVSPEFSLLEEIENAGVEVPYMCRVGVCGECKSDVLELEGEISHRDTYLSDEERAGNKKIMTCVSRCSAESRLVLDR